MYAPVTLFRQDEGSFDVGRVQQRQGIFPVGDAGNAPARCAYRPGTDTETLGMPAAVGGLTGIGPAAARLAELVGNACIGGLRQEAHQARVRQGAGIRHVNRRSSAQPGVVGSVFRPVPGGQVVGRGGIDRNRQVRIEGIGGYPRSPRADLFLDGEGRQQVDLGGASLTSSIRVATPRRLSSALAETLGPTWVNGWQRWRGRPVCSAVAARSQVDAQVPTEMLRRRSSGVGQVDRASADHAGDMVLADPDRLTGQLARIDAADRLKAEQPFPIVGDKHEPDLVHVGRQHHPQRRGPAFLPGR